MDEPRSSSFSRRKRKILIAMDGSKHSEFAFKCKKYFLSCVCLLFRFVIAFSRVLYLGQKRVRV